MKIIAIIQARMESTRLPGKVLKTVAGEPMLQRIVTRVRQCKSLDAVIVATSLNSANDMIEDFCIQQNIWCFRGSENDVLDRYYQCAKQYQGDIIIRLTADNVFVDPGIIEEAIQYFYSREQLDYLYYKEGLPLGLAVEVFTIKALEKAHQETCDPDCREHVTLYMYRTPERFRCIREIGQEDYHSLRLTMDTEQDYQLISILYDRLLQKGLEVSYKNVMKELLRDDELRSINANIIQKTPTYGLKDSAEI